MSDRWQDKCALLERRGSDSIVPSPSGPWLALVQRGVEIALRSAPSDARQGFHLVYEAVRERTVEIKLLGCRVDTALLTIKREVALCATIATDSRGSAEAIDPGRVAGLLDAVVRWCVGAYYITN
jgi:hypothetical protein